MTIPPHIQDVLNRLQGVHQTGEHQWEARCPSHDDQHASLSIGIGDDDRGLLNCHAGCHTLTVLRTIGLGLRDLYPSDHPHREERRGRHHGNIVATYDYRNANGELLFEVVRFEPKDFRQRRPNGRGGWVWGIGNVDRVLYRLPELLSVPHAQEWVYVVEGEKDADRLISAGLLATCNPGGAGKWSRLADDSALHGRRVCIIADADGPGRNHAADVATRLHGRAADVRVIELPGAKDAAEWFAAGGTVKRLAELRDAAPTFIPSDSLRRPRIVQTNAHLRDLTAECIAALQAANNPPTVFVRCGELVRVAVDEHGRPRVEPFDRASLRGRLCEIADYYTLRKSGDDWDEIVADPKIALVENIMTRGTWDLPPLSGVTRAPILRSDGSICTSPGYDPETRLYYYPQPGMRLGEIPANPDVHDVDAAIDQLSEIIADFPFADDASRANALALLLTLLMRPVIAGHVPLAIVDAPVQGTGKSLLVTVLATIALGTVCGESVPSSGSNAEDEWRKKITSLLLRGTPFVLLDNVADGTAIDSPALAAVLTTDEWSDRKLGSSESIVLPVRAVWAATGNNLRVEGDMPRRCYLVRLDANAEQPWVREGFRIADLEQHVHDHRAELLAAAFTVIRGWYVAGCPQFVVPRLGGFDGWARTVGSVLANAGVIGFLGNLDQISRARDDETQQWARFFEAWSYEFGDRWADTDQVCSRIVGAANGVHDSAIPDNILVQRDRGPGAVRRSLGRSLTRLVGRIYNGRKLIVMIHSHRKVKLWRLQQMNETQEERKAREAEAMRDINETGNLW